MTVVVKQGDAMVDRLQVERGDNNRVNLRQGTYTVEIEGPSNGLWLTDDRVVIARDRPASIAVRSAREALPTQSAISVKQRTYQGHPYSYWYDILTREQDAKTLSDAMRAVEILSRDTPQRRESAEATMRLAKRLGGMVIGGDDESGKYMDAMRHVFPNYYPEPGLEVVTETLRTGNHRARMAATWMLLDFRSGALGETADPERAEAARLYLQRQATNVNGQSSVVRDLITAIGEAVEINPSTSVEQRWMNQILFGSACELIPIARDGGQVPKWLDEHVQQVIDEASESIAEESGNAQVPWARLYSFAHVVDAAIEMHREGRVEVSPKLVATYFVHSAVTPTNRDWPGLFETVSETFDGGADQLRQRIRSRIEKIVAGNYSDEPNYPALGGLAGPQSFMKRNQEFWKAAFVLMGDDTTTPEESLRLLEMLDNATSGRTSVIPGEIKPALSAAIAKLSAREK